MSEYSVNVPQIISEIEYRLYLLGSEDGRDTVVRKQGILKFEVLLLRVERRLLELVIGEGGRDGALVGVGEAGAEHEGVDGARLGDRDLGVGGGGGDRGNLGLGLHHGRLGVRHRLDPLDLAHEQLPQLRLGHDLQQRRLCEQK